MKFAVFALLGGVSAWGNDIINIAKKVDEGMKKFDFNNDGLISRSEYASANWSGTGFDQVDANGDQVLSRDELIKFFQQLTGQDGSQPGGGPVLLFDLPDIQVDKAKLNSALNGLGQWAQRDKAAR